MTDAQKIAGGLSFVGAMMAGMGLGMAMGYLVPGLFIGMGTGMLAFAYIVLAKRFRS
jgi:hypothetical protein